MTTTARANPYSPAHGAAPADHGHRPPRPPARRVRRARDRRPGGHDAGQRPLPDGLLGLGRHPRRDAGRRAPHDRRSLPHPVGRAAGAGRRRRPGRDRHRPGGRAAQGGRAPCSTPPAAARIGLEADNVTWSGAAHLGRPPRRRPARRHRQRRRGAARAQGRRRDRPHGAGRRHRRRRALRGAPAHEPGRHRGALRPGARYRHAPRRRREHRLRDDRRRRRELGQAAPPPGRPHASTRATPSWSTSAPPSRATAPT